MIFKKIGLNLLFSFVIVVSNQQMYGFFDFSSAGQNIGIGVTLDENVTFNIHYALHFKNSSRYLATVGFSLTEVPFADEFNARFYLQCKHADGLNSLQDLTSLVAVNDGSQVSDTDATSHDFVDSRKSNHSFLLRSIFSLSKSIVFHITHKSSGWSFRTGAELMTEMLNAKDQDFSEFLNNITKELTRDHQNGVAALKKGNISFNDALFAQVIGNYALYIHVVASGILAAGQRANFEKQWAKILQSARDGWNAAARAKMLAQVKNRSLATSKRKRRSVAISERKSRLVKDQCEEHNGDNEHNITDVNKSVRTLAKAF